ncbi:unnamed protein product [Dracunculus medinensis]|uniref:ADP/ATP translocase n=1 Tax=Dracunculus medinensis TaxID=318479 RepID=A0A0N4UH43_DRAME|nr:unnamed protein product [Dracunculus medinensis]
MHFRDEIGDNSLTLHSILLKYLLSCSAALVAETATYPLDIVKTRLQVMALTDTDQITSKSKSARGMFRVAYNIIRQESLTSLWRGVTPAIYRHYVYTGIRMGCYEIIRDKLFDKEKDVIFPAC